jgi:hypothetical protein
MPFRSSNVGPFMDQTLCSRDDSADEDVVITGVCWELLTQCRRSQLGRTKVVCRRLASGSGRSARSSMHIYYRPASAALVVCDQALADQRSSGQRFAKRHAIQPISRCLRPLAGQANVVGQLGEKSMTRYSVAGVLRAARQVS